MGLYPLRRLGCLRQTVKVILNLVAPFVYAISHILLANAIGEENEANDQASMSVQGWCAHYGSCGAEPDEFIYVSG